ncbi:MAG: hypothetical protein R3Y43_02250 [Alphaproteobacteria bacterium]
MKYLTTILTICFITTSCSVVKKKEAPTYTQLINLPNNPEVVANPFEIYNSMARAVKYNLDRLLEEHEIKITEINTTEEEIKTPQQQITILTEIENPTDIYQIYKALDAAILIKENTQNANIQHITQNLILAGINSYNKASFAKNKSVDLSRSETYYERRLDKLLSKEKGLVDTSKEEELEKQEIEVFLFNSKEMQELYQTNLTEFNQLEKADYTNVKFGSKKYFELKTFQNNLKLENFEELALKNKVIDNLKYERNLLVQNFPNAYRLHMSDDTYKNTYLHQQVLNQGNEVALRVLDGSISVQTAKLLRIRLAFYIAKITKFEYFNTLEQYKKSTQDKSIKNRANIIKLEYALNNALSNYALSVQNLYFSADPIDLPLTEINRAVDIVAKKIKTYTNQNLASILATQEYPQKNTSYKIPNVNAEKQWAPRGENWLEEVVK